MLLTHILLFIDSHTYWDRVCVYRPRNCLPVTAPRLTIITVFTSRLSPKLKGSHRMVSNLLFTESCRSHSNGKYSYKEFLRFPREHNEDIIEEGLPLASTNNGQKRLSSIMHLVLDVGVSLCLESHELFG